MTGAVADHLPPVPTAHTPGNTLPSGLSRCVCSGLFCTAARPILCPTHELFSGTGTFREQSERGKGLTSGPWECGLRWGRDRSHRLGGRRPELWQSMLPDEGTTGAGRPGGWQSRSGGPAGQLHAAAPTAKGLGPTHHRGAYRSRTAASQPPSPGSGAGNAGNGDRGGGCIFLRPLQAQPRRTSTRHNLPAATARGHGGHRHLQQGVPWVPAGAGPVQAAPSSLTGGGALPPLPRWSSPVLPCPSHSSTAMGLGAPGTQRGQDSSQFMAAETNHHPEPEAGTAFNVVLKGTTLLLCPYFRAVCSIY